MLTIIYDPLKGYCVPDALAEDFVKKQYDFEINSNPDQEVSVSNEIIISTARALIKKGEIDHKNIQFKFNDTILAPDKNGQLQDWPQGFCDYYDKCLEILVTWD
jgi:hypothetical protein